MQKNRDEWLILGVTEKGKIFRPSDWADRLCGAFAYYSNNGRWAYSDHIYPVFHEGIISARIHSTLQMLDPAGYEFVMSFASSNQLKLVSLVETEKTTSVTETTDVTDVAWPVREFTFALLLHQSKTNLLWNRYKNKISSY